MEQPKRILVRAPNWLGDHVMALGCYKRIRELYPMSYLVCWYPSGLGGVIPGGLFNEEWEFRKADLKDRKKSREWVQTIQESQFDLSINLNASWSSCWLFFLARIPNRVGFSESGSQILSTASKPFRGVKAGIHKSQLYLDLLSLCGSQSPTSVKWEHKQDSPSERKALWVIAPGAALPLREWPYFPELIFEIKKKYPEKKLKVVGTAVESAWKARLSRWKLEGVEDLIGLTSLSELKELCTNAELVIANDSGVAHLSATLAGARTLVLFGPGNPKYIAPQGSKVIPVVADRQPACSPCEKPYCRAPFGYQKCLKDISVETVLKRIETALAL